jgi:hypothetical protein
MEGQVMQELATVREKVSSLEVWRREAKEEFSSLNARLIYIEKHLLSFQEFVGEWRKEKAERKWLLRLIAGGIITLLTEWVRWQLHL